MCPRTHPRQNSCLIYPFVQTIINFERQTKKMKKNKKQFSRISNSSISHKISFKRHKKPLQKSSNAVNINSSSVKFINPFIFCLFSFRQFSLFILDIFVLSSRRHTKRNRVLHYAHQTKHQVFECKNVIDALF